MTISYKWLSEYLPETIEPERLEKILTGIGLEVESIHPFEEIKGSFQGLVVGEVVSVEKHPNADKLTVTRVNTGKGDLLQIVCGAPNVANGQKVIVAPVGASIFPTNGEPVTMKIAKIRGVESYGMICAEDEVGLGASHEGILVLPPKTQTGTAVKDIYKPYTDTIFEIGLTPNRMDAMSHWGVARDVCAWLSMHDKKTRPKIPNSNSFKVDSHDHGFRVTIENTDACQRYSGLLISGIRVGESPEHIKQRLRSIGIRPINNIVDITNYIQHETGQPLHAFDADRIAGNHIIVKNVAAGTSFITLDEKARKLDGSDLMICDAEKPLCIAGVFGGLSSGVTDKTQNIFLESAWFNPTEIRRTSFRHGLRTDAASRFEKGTDISNTVNVLKRAAMMIREMAGGSIASDVIDVYPNPQPKNEIVLKYHYLKRLSGKNYHPDTAKEILLTLGFYIIKEGLDELWVTAPYHKPDISLPADVVEEIVRIDGLDNIDIPSHILITPSVEPDYKQHAWREKIAMNLTGAGFHEIMTNSITNSAYFNEEQMKSGVKMMNSLSAELDMMRPSMLETGLESIAYNLNRKNNSLRFFEFGKTYQVADSGKFDETEHLVLFVTGNIAEDNWKHKSRKADIFYLQGIITSILDLLGLQTTFEIFKDEILPVGLRASISGSTVLKAGMVARKKLDRFDIRQDVVYADLNWDLLIRFAGYQKRSYTDLTKFPPVNRDLAMIVARKVKYKDIRDAIEQEKLTQLKKIRLFDIFESEKLGTDKKSMAISLTFLDEEKTLTDKEIDEWMAIIIQALEKQAGAVIRKA